MHRRGFLATIAALFCPKPAITAVRVRRLDLDLTRRYTPVQYGLGVSVRRELLENGFAHTYFHARTWEEAELILAETSRQS